MTVIKINNLKTEFLYKSIHKINSKYLDIEECPYSFGTGTNAEIGNNGGAGSSAWGDYSHAEGYNTISGGNSSHAEGYNSSSNGDYSHSEGRGTHVYGEASHTEGWLTSTSSDIIAGHAEGSHTYVDSTAAHSEGSYTKAGGTEAHAEGYYSLATGNGAHVEGDYNLALGESSHAEGAGENSTLIYASLEGSSVKAYKIKSVSLYYDDCWTYGKLPCGYRVTMEEQLPTTYIGYIVSSSVLPSLNYVNSIYKNKLIGTISHISGEYIYISSCGKPRNSISVNDISVDATVYLYTLSNYHNFSGGVASHAEGYCSYAVGDMTHAEGYYSTASNFYSHAEGRHTKATGLASHSEGNTSQATSDAAHAEGARTTASGVASHTEGESTTASNYYSHAEGCYTQATEYGAHAEGYSTIAKGSYSHVEGNNTISGGVNQHVQGKYNIEDTENKYAHIVGGGSASDSRANIHTLDWNGNTWFKGDAKIGGTSYTDTNAKLLATQDYVTNAISALPEPMIFKGSLGTGGTITSLPAAASTNEGFTYKVITAGTYASIAAKIGDTFISDGTKWVLIPSGDEPSGTVTSVAVKMNNETKGTITSSGTIDLGTVITEHQDISGKVDVNNIDITGQTTTIVSLVKALAASNKSYGRWYSKTDGGTSGISDKPTGSTNAGFVCEAICNRFNSATDYRYIVKCWVQSYKSPYIAIVDYSTSTLSWTLLPTSNTNTTYSLTQDSSDGHKITLTPSSGTAQTITIPDNNTVTAIASTTGSGNAVTDISATNGQLTVTKGTTFLTPSSTLDVTKLSEPRFINYATLTKRGIFNITRANRLAFLPADQIIIEKSIDGGTTWTDAGYTDAQKRLLFTGRNGGSIALPKIDGKINTNCMVRITFSAMKYNVPSGTSETEKYNYWNSSYIKSTERYCQLNTLYFWVNSVADRLWCKLEKASGANSTTWVNAFDTSTNANRVGLSGWSGMDVITFDTSTFGGSTSQTGQSWNYRLTFRSCSITTTSDSTLFDNSKLNSSNATGTQSINGISGYGDSVWVSPNNLMSSDHIYSWDESQNTTFPAKVTATSIAKSGGTSSQFLKADGSVDSNSYLTSSSISDTYSATSSNAMSGKAVASALSSFSSGPQNIKDGTGAGSVYTSSAYKPTANYAFAEGCNTVASGDASHAEGYCSESYGQNSHAEGESTIALGSQAHAEGGYSVAGNRGSHAEGGDGDSDLVDFFSATFKGFVIDGDYTRVKIQIDTYNTGEWQRYLCPTGLFFNDSDHQIIGYQGYGLASEYFYWNIILSKAIDASTAIDSTISIKKRVQGTFAAGHYSHAEGRGTGAYFLESHAEGYHSESYGESAHAEGYCTQAGGDYSHSEGKNTLALAAGTHAEGYYGASLGWYSHVEGDKIYYQVDSDNDDNIIITFNTIADDRQSVEATVEYSSSSKYSPISSYDIIYLLHGAHFGDSVVNTVKSISYTASGGVYRRVLKLFMVPGYPLSASYSNGDSFTLTSIIGSVACGRGAHAEGMGTIAYGDGSHTQGIGTLASGKASFAAGYQTVADKANQTVVGKFNKFNLTDLFVVGIGEDKDNRKNGFSVTSDGNGWFSGDIKVGGNGYNNATATVLTSENFQTYIDSYIQSILESRY